MLQPKFNMNQFDKLFKDAEKQMTANAVRVLKYVGENAVNEAKLNGSYNDRTANLRNSIGYVIAIDGRIEVEFFDDAIRGTERYSGEGRKYGLDLAREKALAQHDIALVVVAGMRYAVEVESKGLNVLTSAEQATKSLLTRLLNN